jgi:hypothetical protein
MGDMSLPPDYPTIPVGVYDDIKLVKLARGIAMGIKELPDILFDNSLTLREFDEIRQNSHFNQILAAEVKAWEGASNTSERVRVKAGSLIEEYLPELYARLNDRNEPFMAKMKAFEQLTKLAGWNERDLPAMGSPGDKVSVIINLGNDDKRVYQKELPPKVIDHAPAVMPGPSFEESLDASPHSV